MIKKGLYFFMLQCFFCQVVPLFCMYRKIAMAQLIKIFESKFSLLKESTAVRTIKITLYAYFTDKFFFI